MSLFWNFAKCDAALLFLFSRQLTDLHTNQLTGQHILQLSVKRYTYSFCHAMIVKRMIMASKYQSLLTKYTCQTTHAPFMSNDDELDQIIFE